MAQQPEIAIVVQLLRVLLSFEGQLIVDNEREILIRLVDQKTKSVPDTRFELGRNPMEVRGKIFRI